MVFWDRVGDKRRACRTRGQIDEALSSQQALDISYAIHRVADENASAQRVTTKRDAARGRRECATLVLIFVTAAVTLWQAMLFRQSIKDARSAAYRQHIDTQQAIEAAQTANALSKASAQSGGESTKAALEIQTRQAITASQEVAVLTQQVEIIRESISPHLRKDGIQVHKYLVDGRIKGWMVSPVFVNAGSTTMLNYREWSELQIPLGRSDPDNPACPPPQGDPLPFSRPSNLGPQARIMLEGMPIPAELMESVVAGKRSIYLEGSAVYKDVFAGTAMHHFDWCILLIPNDPDQDRFSPFNVFERSD